MRYVITGASSRTGSIVASRLTELGKELNVIGRDATRLKVFTNNGAIGFEADPTDGVALLRAFRNAEVAWVMLQPNYIPDSTNFRQFQGRIIDALVYAISYSNVKYVVTLSSWGADMESGTGPVAGLRDMEIALNRFPELNVLHLRAGYFMENTLAFIPSIIRYGIVFGPIDPNLKLPFVAIDDVADYAARQLADLGFSGKQVQELHGQRDLSMEEAVQIIGGAIQMPELHYEQVPNLDFVNSLLDSGVSEHVAGLMDEVVNGINRGHLRMATARNAASTTPTSFESFVKTSFEPAHFRALRGTA
jgi:uncharacterized protein YbjT (DUF2867 family)